MKTAKKVLSLVLSLALVASLAVTAFAAEATYVGLYDVIEVKDGSNNPIRVEEFERSPGDNYLSIYPLLESSRTLTIDVDSTQALVVGSAASNVVTINSGSPGGVYQVTLSGNVSDYARNSEHLLLVDKDDTDNVFYDITLWPSTGIALDIDGDGYIEIKKSSSANATELGGIARPDTEYPLAVAERDDLVTIKTIPNAANLVATVTVNGTIAVAPEADAPDTFVVKPVDHLLVGKYNKIVIKFEEPVPEVLDFTATYAGLEDPLFQDFVADDDTFNIYAPTSTIAKANGVIVMDLENEGVKVKDGSINTNTIDTVTVNEKKVEIKLKDVDFDDWNTRDFTLVLKDGEEFDISIFGSAVFKNTITGWGEVKYEYVTPRLPTDNRVDDVMNGPVYAENSRDIGAANAMYVTLTPEAGFKPGEYKITGVADEAFELTDPVAANPGRYTLVAKEAIIYTATANFPDVTASALTATGDGVNFKVYEYVEKGSVVRYDVYYQEAQLKEDKLELKIEAGDGTTVAWTRLGSNDGIDTLTVANGVATVKPTPLPANVTRGYLSAYRPNLNLAITEGGTTKDIPVLVYPDAALKVTIGNGGTVEMGWASGINNLEPDEIKSGSHVIDLLDEVILDIVPDPDYEIAIVTFGLANNAVEVDAYDFDNDPTVERIGTDGVTKAPYDPANNGTWYVLPVIEESDIYELNVTFTYTGTTDTGSGDSRHRATGSTSSNQQTTTTTPSAPAPSVVAAATDAEVTAAVAAAGEGDVKLVNKSVTAEQFALIGDKTVIVDTTSSTGAVLTRTWIEGGSGLNSFAPGGSTATQGAVNALATFKLYYANETFYAFELAQKDAIGGTAHMALWIGSGLESPLYAYLYNASTNSYVPVTCYVDAAGYVHVEVTTGGTLVFTNAPLEAK